MGRQMRNIAEFMASVYEDLSEWTTYYERIHHWSLCARGSPTFATRGRSRERHHTPCSPPKLAFEHILYPSYRPGKSLYKKGQSFHQRTSNPETNSTMIDLAADVNHHSSSKKHWRRIPYQGSSSTSWWIHAFAVDDQLGQQHCGWRGGRIGRRTWWRWWFLLWMFRWRILK